LAAGSGGSFQPQLDVEQSFLIGVVMLSAIRHVMEQGVGTDLRALPVLSRVQKKIRRRGGLGTRSEIIGQDLIDSRWAP
jgi:hypothetical protein